jgi:histidinol-phosphate aminotransferase
MAGTRIGFAMGNEKLIKAMNDVKYSINSYTMNQPSLYLGVEAIKDEEYFREHIDKIISTREKTTVQLKKLGFKVLESKTNFVFISHNKYSAEEIFTALREEKIFVRFFNLPRISNYLRVTIGTDQEMEAFIRFLEGYLK